MLKQIEWPGIAPRWTIPRTLGVVVFYLLAPLGFSAQISPGPLSRAHQSLNGPAQCTACHRLGGGGEKLKCLECHVEIAQRVSAHRGYHATVVPQLSNEQCAHCHSEHNGENFQIIHWEPSEKAFDHTKTGYVLEGKHAALTCQQCHQAAHVSPAERATIKIKDLNHTFLGLSRECISCHTDPHNGRLGTDCSRCHNFNDWKTVPSFDHSKTRYPLTGEHAHIACQKCHKPDPARPQFVKYFGIPFGKCADCHADPHHGVFKAECESCHATAGWKQISLPQVSTEFDHSKTKYPLQGKHAAVRCEACHKGGNFNLPLPFNRCLDCHADAHHGQFLARKDGGDCAPCHTLDGFKPTTFGVPEHASTNYPLEGKHANTPCVKCHIPAGLNTLYKIKLTACKDCHADVHKGQFAGPPSQNRCEDCHTVHGFSPSTFTLARHKTTRFPLIGGHVATPCVACHQARKPPGGDLPAPYHFSSLSCAECHEDPHRGEFVARMRKLGPDGKPADCEACHSMRSWTEEVRFDHNTTHLPLIGAHRALACLSCHKPPNLEVTLRNVVYSSAPTECHACHEEPHGRQFAVNGKNPECTSCHDSFRWKPSLFDHDKRTEFALKGAHEQTPCAGCHKDLRLVDGKQVLFYKPTPKQCAACHGPEKLKKR